MKYCDSCRGIAYRKQHAENEKRNRAKRKERKLASESQSTQAE